MATPEMKPSSIEIRSDAGSFAQEVVGLDVRTLSNEDFGQIENAFNESGVVYIRGQTLDPEDLISFSKRFGAIESHPRQEYALEGHPQIHVLSNIKDGERSIGSAYAGDEWHTDLCFMNSPSRMSILYSIEIPFDDDGKVLGDTLFTSAANAYDDLDSEMKDFISDKRGFMQYNRRQEIKRLERMKDHPRPPLSDEVKALTPDITQPMVRTHPITGRKSIYVNQVYTFGIEGMEENESAPILKKLCDHVTRQDRIYRHKWQVGDILMWDNALTQHKALADYRMPQRRKLIRTSVTGTEVF
jgi:taurine dioxygenase